MTNLVAKIESRLSENSRSIKTYASHQFAEAQGERLSKLFDAVNATQTRNPILGTTWILVFLPNVKRWTVIFNLTQWVQANGGCYMGWYAQRGFFTI